MNNFANYESKFSDIIVKEHLVDLSQFHKSRFFDEVPLFSRESEIAFLSRHTEDEASVILLWFALRFFHSVISYKKHRAAYFAAITVWNYSETDPFIPNLFVCSGCIPRLKKLVLNEATTQFGKRIKRLVSRLGLRVRFEVLEDNSTNRDMQRVFISQYVKPYPSFVPLAYFRKALNHVE
jgi:hypothetical protein